jgi:hypothetical protein
MVRWPRASAIVRSSQPLSRRMTARVCRSPYGVRPGPISPSCSSFYRSLPHAELKPLKVHGVPLELAQSVVAIDRARCREYPATGLAGARKLALRSWSGVLQSRRLSRNSLAALTRLSAQARNTSSTREQGAYDSVPPPARRGALDRSMAGSIPALPLAAGYP